MASLNRRFFLKTSSFGILPTFIPFTSSLVSDTKVNQKLAQVSDRSIKFWGDGEIFEPKYYLNELLKIHATSPIEQDWYGVGGVVETLEKKFAEITGKEKAIYLPSGTMANQLAISVLSAENTKIFVQETSHVYRDEADASQSVFHKRLMPLAKGETFFTAQQLQTAIETMAEEEVFKSGIGAVSIENPVRRKDGMFVPIEEIRKISQYCRKNNIKLHLDGARVHVASAWTGVSVKEYASYFDTIYISLYKYLGASGGAILCGDTTIINKIPHLIKIHGGNMLGNWVNVAMALSRLEHIEMQLQEVIKQANSVFSAINQLSGIKITALPNGTNIYSLELAKEINGEKMAMSLYKNFNIQIPPLNDKNHTFLTVNETLLYQNSDYIINAFRKSI